VKSWVIGELNIVNIPKAGSELLPGHHFPIKNIRTLLK